MQFLFKNGDDDYQKRIKNVAEKLHKLAEKLKEKGEEDFIIDWETFTIDYMKAGEWTSDLENRLWKEKRSNMWKDDINEKLAELGYQEFLFSEFNEGVKLRWGNIAMWKMAIAGAKKISNIAIRRSAKLELFSENLIGIGAKKGLSIAEIGLSLVKQLYGEIGTNKFLTKKEKKELLNEIEKLIPNNKTDENK